MSVSLPVIEGFRPIDQAAAPDSSERCDFLAKRGNKLARRCVALALGAATAIGALAAPAKAAYDDISGLVRTANHMAGVNPEETLNKQALPNAIDTVDTANTSIGLPIFDLDGLHDGHATVLVNNYECLNKIMLRAAKVNSASREATVRRMIDDQTMVLSTQLPQVTLRITCNTEVTRPHETRPLPIFKKN